MFAARMSSLSLSTMALVAAGAFLPAHARVCEKQMESFSGYLILEIALCQTKMPNLGLIVVF
jgi:hypothetical protein